MREGHLLPLDGLSPEERRWLGTHYPWVDLRTFDFSAHPPHLDMSWKPFISGQMTSEPRGLVAWLDAGDVVRKEPRLLAALGKCFGMYSPCSSKMI